MPAPVLVEAGELLVWFLFLVLIVWGGSTALQRLVALRFCGFASMGVDYAMAAMDCLLPRFAPPGWLYGPVWMALYGLHAGAGYRLRLLGNWTDAASVARTPLALQATLLSLLLVWPAVYSGALLRWLGNGVHAAALSLSVAAAVLAWNVDRFAAGVFVATAVWLAYALLVALAIERARAAAAAAGAGTGAPAGADRTLPRFARAEPGGGSPVSVVIAPPDTYGQIGASKQRAPQLAPVAPQQQMEALKPAPAAPLTPAQQRALMQEDERRALAEARAEKRRLADAAMWAAVTPSGMPSAASSSPSSSAQPTWRQRTTGGGAARDTDGPVYGVPGTYNDSGGDLEI